MQLEIDDIADVMAGLVREATAPIIAANEVIAAENRALADRVVALEGREIPDVADFCDEAAVRGIVEATLPDVEARMQPIHAKVEAMAECNVERDARLAELEVREPPVAGADYDIEAVRTMIEAAISERVAELPPPDPGLPGRDGIDGKDADPAEVAKALQPFIVGELGAEIIKLPPAEPGKDGTSVTVDDVAPLIAGEVEKAVSALPLAEPGRDGADCDMEAVGAMLDAKVAAALSALPPAEKGKDGEVDMEAISALIDKAVAGRPLPKDGKDADMDVVGAMVAESVRAAIAGLPVPKDGVGMASAFKDHEGCLILTMTDGATHNIGRIDGKDGETFTLDDFDIESLDERSIKLKFTRGEVCHSFELEFPVPVYRGVFREGDAYARGDMVTWGGSLWHCDKGTAEKPGAIDWTLAAKRGRDGKDFQAAA